MKITSFSGARVPAVAAFKPAVAQNPAVKFASAHELSRKRLVELFDGLSADLAAGKIKVKQIVTSEHAILDINGKDYDFYASKDSWYIRREVKELEPYRSSILRRRLKKEISYETSISLGTKFWSSDRRLYYEDRVEDRKEMKSRYRLYIKEENEGPVMKRGEDFFRLLTSKVFTPEALKPFFPDKLDY